MREDLLLEMVATGRASGNRFHAAVEGMIADALATSRHVFAHRLAEALTGEYPAPPERHHRPPAKPKDNAYVRRVEPRRRLDDVALRVDVRRDLSELIAEHHRSEVLRSNNLEPRHKILLVGPPGNGKP